MASRPGCWFHTFTSGSQPSGCVGSVSCRRTGRDSGRRTATTATETPGESNGMTAPKVMDVDTAKLVPTCPRMRWREGEILEVVTETERVRSLVLRVPDWPGHVPGQHVDVRLTAEDGYQAERSYSIASPPERAEVVLTIERVEDGEV